MFGRHAWFADVGMVFTMTKASLNSHTHEALVAMAPPRMLPELRREASISKSVFTGRQSCGHLFVEIKAISLEWQTTGIAYSQELL